MEELKCLNCQTSHHHTFHLKSGLKSVMIDFVISPSNFSLFDRGESCFIGNLSPCQASALEAQLILLGYILTKSPKGYWVKKA